jgi:P pilus assembly chaperone PapD
MKTINSRRLASSLALVLWLGFSHSGGSAVKPLYTRVIVNATAKETPVEIINESQSAYMVQSWIEDLNGNDKNIPLVLTPPVMRLDPERQGKLRIVVMPTQIPQDRESAYWLNIQEIPPKAKSQGGNILTVAIRSKIKVFVRPESLASKKDEAAKAIDHLQWGYERDGRKVWLKVQNPTPYYVSFGELTVKGSGMKAIDVSERFTMAAPMASQRYSIPSSYIGKKITVTYRTINDYGGVSKALNKEIQL